MNLRNLVISFVLLGVCVVPSLSAQAFMEEDIVILNKEDIAKLTNEQVIDAYIDTVVELEASKSFHATVRYTPQEYATYKSIMRYRVHLLMEINKRGLELPPEAK
jgi:hypothetical protein